MDLIHKINYYVYEIDRQLLISPLWYQIWTSLSEEIDDSVWQGTEVEGILLIPFIRREISRYDFGGNTQ